MRAATHLTGDDCQFHQCLAAEHRELDSFAHEPDTLVTDGELFLGEGLAELADVQQRHRAVRATTFSRNTRKSPSQP
ncbi:hypothetical protein ACIGFK_00190 [Streptomyces sp. NPDC085524]|uniref:hypothetical protein n=1 Tax=unclassified Streptomyces TaxID=2593676 RepID=UPI0035D8495A